MEKRIDLLKQGESFLAAKGLLNPDGEAQICLSHILGCERFQLYLDDLAVPQQEHNDYWHLLAQRASGLPLQYLIGYTEFMGLKFKVSPGVFIPRPETEIVTETAINLITNQWFDKLTIPRTIPSKVEGLTNQPTNHPTILDIGTGCGNIAISIAKAVSKGQIFAGDIADAALALARENSALHQADIAVIKSDLFSGIRQENYFSLIVSNPPYIKQGQIRQLPAEVGYEPKLALDGGRDGLEFYRRIIREAANYLSTGGWLVLELGDDQAQSVEQIFDQTKGWGKISTVRDYHDIQRVIVAKKV